MATPEAAPAAPRPGHHRHRDHAGRRWALEEAEILDEMELRRQGQRRRRLRIIMFCLLFCVTAAITSTIGAILVPLETPEEARLQKGRWTAKTTDSATRPPVSTSTLTPPPHSNTTDDEMDFKVVIEVQAKDLAAARTFCSKEKLQGNLLYVDNVDEDRALPLLLEAALKEKNDSDLQACKQGVLIGITSVREKKWRSIDGQHYLPGIDLSPDYGLGDTQCVILIPPTFQPSNASCHDAYACWICVNNCSTQPCYSLHFHSGRQLLTFFQAERSCFNETVGGRFGFVSALGISKEQQSFIERKTSVDTAFCRNKAIMTRSVLPGNAYEVQMTPHNASDLFSTFVVQDITVELAFVPERLDHPNAYNCLAVSLTGNYTWKQVACDSAMCFACRVPPDYKEVKYRNEVDRFEDNLDEEWYDFQSEFPEPVVEEEEYEEDEEDYEED